MRGLAQDLYDNVEGPFMLDEGVSSLSGWSPTRRAAQPPSRSPTQAGPAAIPAAVAGTRSRDVDYYTDEALIAILLGLGSHEHPLDPGVYCALLRDIANGVVRTYPGSLFTYQFLHTFVDARSLGVRRCPDKPLDDWHENSRRAIFKTIERAESAPEWPTYGSEAWGISAAEGPGDEYRAYGAPAVAVDATPDEDGTVTYYAIASALSFGPDLRERALEALRAGYDRGGHWHHRFGLPDAFNEAIQGASLPTVPAPLRTSGEWLQRAGFAIDLGPMLLHIENARSGLVHRLIGANRNIRRALKRLPGSHNCQEQTQSGPLGENLEDRPVSHLGAFCEDIGIPSTPKGEFVHDPVDGRTSAACRLKPGGGAFDNLHCFTNLQTVSGTPPLVFGVDFKLPVGTSTTCRRRRSCRGSSSR